MNGRWNISGRDTAVVGVRCQEVRGPGVACFVGLRMGIEAGSSELHTSEEEIAGQAQASPKHFPSEGWG